jgi:hypothetical protein
MTEQAKLSETRQSGGFGRADAHAIPLGGQCRSFGRFARVIAQALEHAHALSGQREHPVLQLSQPLGIRWAGRSRCDRGRRQRFACAMSRDLCGSSNSTMRVKRREAMRWEREDARRTAMSTAAKSIASPAENCICDGATDGGGPVACDAFSGRSAKAGFVKSISSASSMITSAAAHGEAAADTEAETGRDATDGGGGGGGSTAGTLRGAGTAVGIMRPSFWSNGCAQHSTAQDRDSGSAQNKEAERRGEDGRTAGDLGRGMADCPMRGGGFHCAFRSAFHPLLTTSAGVCGGVN